MTGPMNRKQAIEWLRERTWSFVDDDDVMVGVVVLSAHAAVRIVDALTPTAPSREQIARRLQMTGAEVGGMADSKVSPPTRGTLTNAAADHLADRILELLEQHGWRLHEEADDA